jgi:hypothetical protein
MHDVLEDMRIDIETRGLSSNTVGTCYYCRKLPEDRPPRSVASEASRDDPRWAAELRSSESGDRERSVRGVREHAQTMLRLRLCSLEGPQPAERSGA